MDKKPFNLKDIILAVKEDLLSMSERDFSELLEQHKNGDVAKALLELGVFEGREIENAAFSEGLQEEIKTIFAKQQFTYELPSLKPIHIESSFKAIESANLQLTKFMAPFLNLSERLAPLHTISWPVIKVNEFVLPKFNDEFFKLMTPIKVEWPTSMSSIDIGTFSNLELPEIKPLEFVLPQIPQPTMDFLNTEWAQMLGTNSALRKEYLKFEELSASLNMAEELDSLELVEINSDLMDTTESSMVEIKESSNCSFNSEDENDNGFFEAA